MLPTAMHYSHTLLKEIVKNGDTVIDATMGNGHDTMLLAQLVGPQGKVYSFDVQLLALEKTKKRLTEAALADRVQLLLAGHETIATQLAENEVITACIFNLGYLPKGDKQIITLPKTTEIALNSTLHHLAEGGRVIIVAYYGHEGGPAELAMVNDYCQNLPQEIYNVLTYQFINQRNAPPILFCIEKKLRC